MSENKEAHKNNNNSKDNFAIDISIKIVKQAAKIK